MPRLGSGRGAGLGCRAGRGEGLGWGDGVVRADWSSVAGAGSAGCGPVDAVRVRAADGDVVVAAHRGPTWDKTDEKDAVLIARLTAQLRCYVPEPVDETWGRLRHLGVRREQLITEAGSEVQQRRDLLECVWPAALDTARQPFGRARGWPPCR